MRIEGWEAKLHDYLVAAHRLEFAWGVNDCALWAAEWVRVCTGEDHTAEWRGTYTTERGAKVRIKRLGYGGLIGIADAHLPQRPPLLAQRGDLVRHPQDCLGVCNGMRSYFLTFQGVEVIDTAACTHAWKVG